MPSIYEYVGQSKKRSIYDYVGERPASDLDSLRLDSAAQPAASTDVSRATLQPDTGVQTPPFNPLSPSS